MLYIHDVWVNWFEGEEKGYNISHFHEWRTNDKIELIDRFPVFRVTEELFDHIENSLEDIPEKLLKKMYRQTYIMKGAKKEILDYACIITDGQSVLAIDAVKYSIPIRKSRLVPRQDKIVLQMVKDREPKSYQFTKQSFQNDNDSFSLKSEHVVGLTRKEKQLKQLLMMALSHLQITANLEEIRYWLTEWKPEIYAEIELLNRKRAYSILYDELKYGWSEKHESFAEKLIRGNPFLEELWHHEIRQSKRGSTINRNQ